MTGGREGGAPGDLGEIRRTDEIIDSLASRHRPLRRALGDPAVTLLASLAADVDAVPLPPVRPGRHRPAVAAAAALVAMAAWLVAVAGLLIAVTVSRLTGGRRPGNGG